jgi:hypothetical protein
VIFSGGIIVPFVDPDIWNQPRTPEKVERMQTQDKQAVSKAKSPKPRSRHDYGRPSPPRGWIWPTFILVTAIFTVIISVIFFNNSLDLELDLYNADLWRAILLPATKEEFIDPDDYLGRAKRVLQSTPLIDGHNDFPFLLRQQLHGKIRGNNFENETLTSHTDFQRMKDGMMGGQFWSVYVPCPEDLVPGVDLNDPNKRIPDLNEPSVCITHIILYRGCEKSFLLIQY